MTKQEFIKKWQPRKSGEPYVSTLIKHKEFVADLSALIAQAIADYEEQKRETWKGNNDNAFQPTIDSNPKAFRP